MISRCQVQHLHHHAEQVTKAQQSPYPQPDQDPWPSLGFLASASLALWNMLNTMIYPVAKFQHLQNHALQVMAGCTELPWLRPDQG